MREYLRFIVSFILITLLLPLVIITIGGELSARISDSADKTTKTSVTLKYSGGTETVDMNEYIAGVIAPAMDFCDNEEFLKAMAILCRTYIVYCNENGESFYDNLRFYNETELHEKWQENYLAKINTVKWAVNETEGCYIMAEGRAIFPYVHKITSGYTRAIDSANKNYDSTDIKRGQLFLCEADGTKDSLEETYADQKTVTRSSFVSAMKSVYPAININEYKPEEDIQIIEKTKGGYVVTVSVGNIILDGDTFAEIFSLKSPAFSVRLSKDEICFNTKGEGSGYGLSLCGARRMANSGENAKSICNYYFTNISFSL